MPQQFHKAFRTTICAEGRRADLRCARKLNRATGRKRTLRATTKNDAQNWVKSFANWYNDVHVHSAIRFVTPNARHSGADRKTLANRTILYATVRAQNPKRWSGKIRNW
jgi:hypothetical protein